MRRTMGKIKQILSVLLAVAMVVTCIPQTGLSVMAAEMSDTVESTDMVDNREDVEDEALDNTEDVEDETPDNTEDAEAGADTGANAGTPDSAQDPEAGADTGANNTEAPEAGAETGTDNTQDPEDGTGTETPDSQDNTDSETPDGEDDAEPEQPEEELLPEEGAVPAEGMILDGKSGVNMISVGEHPGCNVILANVANGVTSEMYTADLTKETEYIFRVKPYDYYQINWVRVYYSGTQYDSLKPLGETDEEGYNSYAIPVEKIVEASSNWIEIKANASQLTYPIAAEYDPTLVDFAFTSGVNEKDGKDIVYWGNEVHFTAAVKADRQNTYGITQIICVYEDGTEEECPLSEDGSYYTVPIPQEAIDNLTIEIVVDKLNEYKVQFLPDSQVIKIKDIIVKDMTGSETATAQSEISDADHWELTVLEGSTVQFKLALNSYYEAAEVKETNSDSVLKADENGVYTIEQVTADMIYSITTQEVNREDYYSVLFEEGADSDMDPAAITMELPKGKNDADTVSAAGAKKIGEAVTTQNADWNVTVKAAEGYQVTEVSLNEVTLQPVEGKEDQYQITLSEKGTEDTIRITTKLRMTEEDKTVTFVKKGTHLEFRAKSGMTLASGKTNQYDIAAGTGKVIFDIVVTGAYEPVVTWGEDGSKYPLHDRVSSTVPKSGADKGKTVYTYSIPAVRFGGGGKETETITMTETPIGRTMMVNCDPDEVTLTVSVNGQKITGITTGKGIAYTDILQGSSVTIKAEAQSNCSLESLEGRVRGTTKTVKKKASKGIAEITLTATDDITAEAVSKSLYHANDLKDRSGTDLTPVKNIYTVSYDGSYTATVSRGSNANSRVTFTKAEAWDGKTQLEDIVTPIASGKGVNIRKLNQEIDGRSIAGKKITVKLYAKETPEENEKVVATYTLQITQPITSIKAKSTAVTQTENTKVSYPLTVSKNGELNRLQKEFQATAADTDMVKTAVINEKGELEITTGGKAGSTTVTIASKTTGEAAPYTMTVTVKPVLDPAKTAAPTVKLTQADDVSLTLGLTAKNIAAPVVGKVFYEVIATAKTKTDNSKPSKVKAQVIEYPEKTGDTQSVTLDLADTVKNAEGKNEKVTFGNGEAWDYDVTVRMVYTVSGDIELDEKTGLIHNEGYESSKAKTTKFSTLKPAWETALKLKRGTTTVYTGQKEIVIATPQFSKTTTHKEILQYQVEDITEGLNDYEKLKVAVDADGNIVATAGQMIHSDEKGYYPALHGVGGGTINIPSTKLGKHKIKVTASAANTMYAASAAIDITVVQGIMDLSISVPSDTIYKAAKKAATFKPTIIYNYGDTRYVPKTKKVTWTLKKRVPTANGDGTEDVDIVQGDPLYGMYTINQNNGTVTIKKEYVLSENPAENQFVLYATAADLDNKKKGEDVNKYRLYPTLHSGPSSLITITNESEDIWRLAVAAPESDNSYKIVRLQPDGKNPTVTVAAAELKNAKVIALNSEAELQYSNGRLYEDAVYSAADLAAIAVKTDNLTFKSGSAKNIAVDKEGQITVNKPVKSKLTVTANDGSKKKAELTVVVGYDTPPEIGVRLKHFIGTYTTDSNGATNPDTDEIYRPNVGKIDVDEKGALLIPYSGSNLFELSLMYKDENDEWQIIDGRENVITPNYTLKVSGGKKIDLASGTQIVVTAKEAVITLTDNGNKVNKKPTVHTYKLIDSNYTTAKKPAVKVIKNFYEKAAGTDQQAVIQITDNKNWKDVKTEYGEDKLFARVEIDWTAFNTKNETDLRKLGRQMFGGSKDRVIPIQDRCITLDASDAANAVEMTPGSYKLKVALGVKDDKGTFVPKTAAVVTTVKVIKTQKMTFKPAASYTIGTRDGRGVYLTGTSNIKDNTLYTVTYGKKAQENGKTVYKLKNANIKGAENRFIDYFEIKGEIGEQKIQLKEGLTDDQLEDLKNSKNRDQMLTGYLDYAMQSNVDYYRSNISIKEDGSEGGVKLDTVSGTVKITIKLNDAEKKSAAKYTYPKQVTSNLAGSSVTIPLTVSGRPVDVKYAMLESKDTFWKEAELVTEGNVGNVKLTLKEDAKKGAKTVTLWIAPSDSYYIEKFTQQEQQLDLAYYQKYAVPVKVSITLQDTLTETKTAITKWAAAVNKNPTDWLTNTLTAETLLEKVKAGVTIDSRITLKIAEKTDGTDDFTVTPATPTKTGSIKGNLLLTSKGTNGETILPAVKVPFTLTIPKETQ